VKRIHFDVLTLFPEMFQGWLQASLIHKAQEKGLVSTQLINFRQFATDKHQMVDDMPYGGGDGMVLKPEPLFRAVESLPMTEATQVILFSPQGQPYNQQKAVELAQHDHLILLCGHYAGFDERVRTELATQEISLGDYVLTGGELAAMILIDSISRHIPGVLGNQISAESDSFANGLLEYPQYTRPANFRGLDVPDVLLSGHHARIEQWRRREALRRTFQRRPELLATAPLDEEDRAFLAQLAREAEKQT
jgi:tRNA (guanine37-N1)-methyltransferase